MLSRALVSPTGSPNPFTPPLLTTDPEPPPDPVLYKVEEIAEQLRVSGKTIRRRIKDGTIRTVPIGGRLVRISADELRRLLSGPAPAP